MTRMQGRMLSGFNHNFKYNGKTFHIQTEDGGKDHPWIITHVYLGGAILDTVRTSYEDLLQRSDARELLQDRMKAQHLEEIRKLFAGAIPVPKEENTPND